MNIDDWLAKLYKSDRDGSLVATLVDFQSALASDLDLQTAAAAKLVELNALIAARGVQACAYSSKYWEYLKEAMA